MKSFSPEHYARIVSILTQMKVAMGTPEQIIADLERQPWALQDNIEWLRLDCEEKGLSSTAAGAARLLKLLNVTREGLNLDRQGFIDAANYIEQAFYDESHMRVFLTLEHEKALLAFEPDRFGVEVTKAFPLVAWDVEEAARCLAFDRCTAAVFHLGRVAEIATVTIGKQAGYQSPKEGFGEVLKYMDNKLKQVREDYRNADQLFKGNVEFLSGVTAQMHSVNQAWRQRVSHLDKKYTEEEAMRIWNATRGLMQHLATKVKEEADATAGSPASSSW